MTKIFNWKMDGFHCVCAFGAGDYAVSYFTLINATLIELEQFIDQASSLLIEKHRRRNKWKKKSFCNK